MDHSIKIINEVDAGKLSSSIVSVNGDNVFYIYKDRGDNMLLLPYNNGLLNG